MGSMNRVPLWLSVLAMAAASGLLIVAGCALDKNATRTESVYGRVGGHGGDMIEPKRCLLRVAILSRPFGDPLVNATIWSAADEQVIAPPERRAWEVNGLRIGRIVGELPPEVQALLQETSPQKKVVPATFFVESGEQTLISISDSVEQASLLLNRDERVFGRDFRAASGFFRLTAEHEGSHALALRLVPEIHHGPVQRTFQPLPNASQFAPQQFKINDGQQEETFRELPLNVSVEPGQAVAIGLIPEQKRSLGSFLFTQAVAHSDQRLQKLILIWASRNLEGIIDKSSKAGDRPKPFSRAGAGRSSATARQSAASAAPPAPEPELPPRIARTNPSQSQSQSQSQAQVQTSKAAPPVQTKTDSTAPNDANAGSSGSRSP
jgi:hypothetical protein